VTVTNYIWDVENDTCLMETDENGETKVVYSHEPTQFGGLISQRREGQTYYHHYDALGSTRQLTDADENVTDEYVYTAWGEPVVASGTTENPYRWVGRWGYYWDEATGTYYVRRRDYQPTTSLWLSADLFASYAQSSYVYADASPLNQIDPSGLLCVPARCSETTCAVIFGAFGPFGAFDPLDEVEYREVKDFPTIQAEKGCPDAATLELGKFAVTPFIIQEMRDCVRDKLCRPWTGRAIRDHFREVGYEVFEPCAFPWECKNFKEGFADAIPVTEPFDCSVRFWYRFKGDFFFAGIGRWPPPKEIEMADDIRGPCEAFRDISDVEGLKVELRANNDGACFGVVAAP
jgi:RHS repeat-associated protein